MISENHSNSLIAAFFVVVVAFLHLILALCCSILINKTMKTKKRKNNKKKRKKTKILSRMFFLLGSLYGLVFVSSLFCALKLFFFSLIVFSLFFYFNCTYTLCIIGFLIAVAHCEMILVMVTINRSQVGCGEKETK